MKKLQSTQYFNDAQVHIPGGVNSPVRAFKAVGGEPVFMQSASGAYMQDVDGNQYIDLINSWGSMLLGHANEKIETAVVATVANSLSFGTPTVGEIEMADLICEIMPSIEKVRMVNSGTEATMSAIRLARGYTGRDKIIKFEGCYHGHGDSFLIAAGSGIATLGKPDSPGVTRGTAEDTLTVPFNDLNQLSLMVEQYHTQIAAIILEPIGGNMGCVPPAEGYLKEIRLLCDSYGIVLIFDEVMTGFRIGEAGAQQRYDVTPDLTTLGKIIGGGMPVGAYGGKADIMNMIAPNGPVYQAGTLSGNPVAMAAGMAMLKQLKGNKLLYTQLQNRTTEITNGFEANLEKLGLSYTINQVGSMFSLFFTNKKVIDFHTAKSADVAMFGRYFNEMLQRGIYLAPSQFETLFVSTAIGQQEVDKIIQANFESLQTIHN